MGLTIGVTMGHPSGVGPEILISSSVKFLKRRDKAEILIFGNRRVIDYYCSNMKEGKEFLELMQAQRIGISDIGDLKNDDFIPGRPSESGNIVQIEFIKEAVASAKARKISAIVTMPISKIGMLREGVEVPGHTELFKKLFDVEFVQMLFRTKGKPFVALCTTHLPLNKVASRINRENVLRNIKYLNFALKSLFRIREPRIAVCGLNPHAGEGGLLGREEIEVISPAIEEARSEGIDVSGPFAADSIFYRAFKGKYNALLAMYHDQGLIAVKLSGPFRSVNITLGIPVIRTSPAHGTAFELAGKGTADSSGAFMALETAYSIAARHNGNIVWNF